MSTDLHGHVTYEVSYADTDRMGMVYYGTYLVYFERARTALLQSAGFPYPEMEAKGLGLPVTETHVTYRQPATYGDVLDIYGWLGWARRARLQVVCEVRRDGLLLADGYTVHGCIDLSTMRPTRLPPEILALSPKEAGGNVPPASGPGPEEEGGG